MQTIYSLLRRSGFAAITVASACLISAGCTTTPPSQTESPRVDRHEINSNVDAALSKLYDTVPSSREMARHAKGILVFPTVFQAGLVVGGEYGKGSLRVGNVTEEYYRLTAGSVGWQIGAQSKAVVLLFMTEESLNRFRHGDGWDVGADATVALATIGANGDVDSNTMHKPVVGFVVTNAGLMAGATLQGTKISKIEH
jgi:lipid-binding SYLF domain-containing protein